jgi:hypothetical protein
MHSASCHLSNQRKFIHVMVATHVQAIRRLNAAVLCGPNLRA